MKVWEEVKDFYINYFVNNHFAYLMLFLIKHKIIQKPRTKNGISHKYEEKAREKAKELLKNLLTYDTIKTFTDSTDKILKMDSGGLVAITKYNNILQTTFEELKTMDNTDVFEVVEALYEKSKKNKN